MSEAGNERPRTISIEGQYLVIPDKIRLPPRCVRTNVPTQESDYRRLQLTAGPQFSILVLVLLGLFFALIHAFSRPATLRVQAALSPAVRRRFAMIQCAGGLLVPLAIIGPIVLIAAGLRNEQVVIGLLIGAPLAILVGIAMLFAAPLKCIRKQGGEYWVEGCGREFLTSLTAAARES